MQTTYSICVYFSSGALRVMSERKRQGPNVQMTGGLTKITALLKVFVLGHLQHALSSKQMALRWEVRKTKECPLRTLRIFRDNKRTVAGPYQAKRRVPTCKRLWQQCELSLPKNNLWMIVTSLTIGQSWASCTKSEPKPP